MDQETAQNLFAQGGIIVALDVPKGTQFGIDYHSWSVGPNFKGVKMIPPGFHFVYYSAVDSSAVGANRTGPRTGFFGFIEQGEVRKGRVTLGFLWPNREQQSPICGAHSRVYLFRFNRLTRNLDAADGDSLGLCGGGSHQHTSR